MVKRQPNRRPVRRKRPSDFPSTKRRSTGAARPEVTPEVPEVNPEAPSPSGD
ncbi:hypothetical protein [Kitasatospora sp. NPDC018619]|uniref:hypothetical protein n=1 Tax=unclassified Kitasatospora TaxID=2633591 RepID=UPI0037A20B8D